MRKNKPNNMTMRREATRPPEPFRPAGSQIAALSLTVVKYRRQARRGAAGGLR